jgi:hypothetical protein
MRKLVTKPALALLMKFAQVKRRQIVPCIRSQELAAWLQLKVMGTVVITWLEF